MTFEQALIAAVITEGGVIAYLGQLLIGYLRAETEAKVAEARSRDAQTAMIGGLKEMVGKLSEVIDQCGSKNSQP